MRNGNPQTNQSKDQNLHSATTIAVSNTPAVFVAQFTCIRGCRRGPHMPIVQSVNTQARPGAGRSQFTYLSTPSTTTMSSFLLEVGGAGPSAARIYNHSSGCHSSDSRTTRDERPQNEPYQISGGLFLQSFFKCRHKRTTGLGCSGVADPTWTSVEASAPPARRAGITATLWPWLLVSGIVWWVSVGNEIFGLLSFGFSSFACRKPSWNWR